MGRRGTLNFNTTLGHLTRERESYSARVEEGGGGQKIEKKRWDRDLDQTSEL